MPPLFAAEPSSATYMVVPLGLIEKLYGLRPLHTIPGKLVVVCPVVVGVPVPTVFTHVKVADPLTI